MRWFRRRDRHAGRGSRLAAFAYAAGWVIGAAVLVMILLALLDDGDAGEVSLPPVREVELTAAAREAGCALHRARPGERLNPPVSGGLGSLPARPGVYENPPSASALVAALRDGVVVIQFRGIDGAGRELLSKLQEAVPEGTIVTPNGTGMPFAVSAASYRRLLGCRELTDASIDAIRLFRGRFVGTGPDA